MKPKTPLQAVHLTAAIRQLEAALSDLKEAGETTAAMRIGAVLGGLK